MQRCASLRCDLRQGEISIDRNCRAWPRCSRGYRPVKAMVRLPKQGRSIWKILMV